ncbi:YybH family protein [Streptomyces sp. NPDC048639]|uniref:YybH family protein n=1 Tax=Streptomyces sp. NPDC048639 TaxID=3365581 RepID=UPI003723253B
MTTDISADVAAIHEVIDARTQALREKDPQRIITHYAPAVVAFDLAPPLATTGVDAQAIGAWLTTWDGPLGYEVEQLAVSAAGDVAFTHSLDHMHGRQSGATTDLWFRTTLGLERIGGRWLITHEHQSTPFYMDGSGKAALDLAP